MRVVRLSADGFGCLKGWESPRIEKNIVIVYGNNESGKSTLFKMVETLLYGWSPATANKNPYVPWDESQASCSGSISVEKTKLHIGRRLRGRPTGFLHIGDDQINIANRPIFAVEHLPKAIYNEVYALTLDELSLPSRALWEKLKGQLLADQYYSFLRPSNEVIGDLEREANSLWRPDRRGKPRAKVLRQELLKTREKLLDAKQNDKELYRLEAKIVAEQARLDKLTCEKVELTAYIDWCEKILPILNKEAQIQKLLKGAGAKAPFNDISPTVEDDLVAMEEERKKLKEKIQCEMQKIGKLNELVDEITKSDIKLYSNKKEIEGLVRSYERLAENLDKRLKVEKEIATVESLLIRDGDELIIGGWKDVYTDSLKTIDAAVLRQKVHIYSGMKANIEQKRAELSALKVDNLSKLGATKLMPAGIVFAILGIIGFFLSDTLFKFGGMLSLAISIICLLFGWNTSNSERERKKAILKVERELKMLDDEIKEVQEEVHQCLQGVPFASVDETYMGKNIIIDVDRLIRHINRLTQLNREHIYIKSDIDDKVNIIDRLMKDCMLEPGRDVLDDVDRLDNALNIARDKKYRAKEAKERIKGGKSNIKQLQSELEALDKVREDIVLKLEKFDGEDLKTQIEDLRRRRELYSKAMLLKDELDMEKASLPDNCFEDLNRWYVKNRDRKVLNFDEVAKARVRIDELDREINSLNLNIGALKKEIEQRQKLEAAHEIKGQIDRIESEIAKSATKRDRLALLRNIIDVADKSFKEDYQPDILKKASKYMNIITGGKYCRIFIPENNEEMVAIQQCGNPYPIEVGETISRGTQEQIYLALRLALMDHLDIKFPMPIFLDEIFINWDGIRLQNAIKLIQKIGKVRQIFIFTCHSWWTEYLSDNLDAQIIAMS